MQKRLPLPVGTVLQGRYKIIGQLGAGGMGAVYEAYNERTSASVALKETFASDDFLVSAFEREAKLLANLDHEAFPKVADYFAENDGYFLVMELIRGKDLAEMLKENGKPFDVETVLNWADQILDALEDLHSQGIVHRDIKPANIKLNQRGKIKLIDFGIAKGTAGDLTKIQTTMGSFAAATMAYAPLEQILRSDTNSFEMLCVGFFEKTNEILQQGTDERADIYALGATLYQLLTNRLPVNAPTRALTAWSGHADKLIPVHQINPQVSVKVSEVLQQAMTIERGNRISKAVEMRKLLGKQHRDEKAEAQQAEILRLQQEAEKSRKNLEIEKQRQIEFEKQQQAELERQHQAQVERQRREKAERERLEREKKEGKTETLPFVTPKPDAEDKRMYWVIGGVAALFLFIVLPLAMIAAYNSTPSMPTNQSANKSATTTTANKAAPSSNNPPTYTNSIGMEFVKIPAGSFIMGSPTSEKDRSDDESPQHKVTINYEFYLGKYEVTQEEYAKVTGRNPSNFKNCPRCPVEQVSWDDAQNYIQKLNAKNDGYEYSLPSESEWEYAARARTTTVFAFGDSLSSKEANFDGNYPYGNAAKGKYLQKTALVGSYQANKFGLYDMHGNVWEWVQDIYNKEGYVGLPVDGSSNMRVGDSSLRVLRGGSFYYFSHVCRSANRDGYSPFFRFYYIGFRLASRVKVSP